MVLRGPASYGFLTAAEMKWGQAFFMVRGRSMQPAKNRKSSLSPFSLPAQALRGQHFERREWFAHQEDVRHG
jgi:hypothetical protein